jgi:hypothetical protein
MAKRRAAKRKATFYWAIEGYDSTRKIFSTKFKTTFISERQIEPLLQALTACAGLTLEEIVGCYLMKHTKLYSRLLEVHLDVKELRRRRTLLMYGSNPHFVARIVKE